MASEKGNTEGDKVDNHRLLRRLMSMIPFGVGNRLFPFVMSLSPVQFLFRNSLKRLDTLQRSLCGRSLAKCEATHFLLTNFLSFWRLQTIAKASDQDFERHIAISGIEHIQRYYGEKGIVLCNSHYGAGKIVPIAISRSGYDVVSLDRLNILGSDHQAHQRLESIELGRRGGTFHLKQLMRMKNALTGKKILHVVGDGYRGTSGKEYTFLGRPRPFRSSFAELAVTTDSVVIPVFSRVQADGSISIEICEPLQDLPAERDKEARIDQLCQQYVGILERYWLASPMDVHKNDIFKYLALEESAASTCNNDLGEVGT